MMMETAEQVETRVAREALRMLIGGVARRCDASGWENEMLSLVEQARDPVDLLDRLAVQRLRERVLPLAARWPEGVSEVLLPALQLTIAAIERGDERKHAYQLMSGLECAILPIRELLDDKAERARQSAAFAASAAGWATMTPRGAQEQSPEVIGGDLVRAPMESAYAATEAEVYAGRVVMPAWESEQLRISRELREAARQEALGATDSATRHKEAVR